MVHTSSRASVASAQVFLPGHKLTTPQTIPLSVVKVLCLLEVTSHLRCINSIGQL